MEKPAQDDSDKYESSDPALAEKGQHKEVHQEDINGTPAQGDKSPEDAHYKWTFTRMVAVAALCVVYVGSQIVLYMVSAGLIFIEPDIHTKVGNWLLTANTLAVTAVCPFVGYLTDLFGRRWICVGGTVMLLISCAVMATAHSLGQSVTAMAIGGVGAGICELTALAGVAEITPARWRGVTTALVTFSIVPFMPQVLYVILIVQASTWRYLFLLTALWNFVGLVGLVFCYHPPPRPKPEGFSRQAFIKEIDWMGAFISITGVTLFLVGLQAGGYQYPWTAAKVLAPLIIGLLLLLAFPVYEYYVPKYPIVPGDIFRGQRVVALAYALVFVAGMDFYSILGFFPIVLQFVYQTSPIEVGVRALCYPWAILGGACIVSALMSYTRGHVRELFFVVAGIMTAFTGALACSTPENPATTITLATFSAFGNGAIVVPALTLALYAAPDNLVGTVGALSLSSRFLGGSVGTAIYFNVFNQQIKKNLPTMVGGAAVKNGLAKDQLPALLEALASPVTAAKAGSLPGVTPAVLKASVMAMQWAYADSLKYVWYTTIPFGVLSMICCLFLPNIRNFMTNRVAVNIH